MCFAFSELLARLVTEYLNAHPLFLFSVILCSSHETTMGFGKYLQYMISIFIQVYTDITIALYI